MDYGPASMPFPTRMTVVRLPGGRLWVHSPIAPDDALFAAVDRLGEVAWLVAPNSIHYWYVADWQARYPAARTLAVPGLAEKAKRDFRIDALLEGPAMPLPGGIARQEEHTSELQSLMRTSYAVLGLNKKKN